MQVMRTLANKAMSVRFTVGVLGLPIICVTLSVGVDAGPKPMDKPEPTKKTAAKNQKPVSIPKEEIYTTSSEDGFKKQLLASFYSTKKGENRKPVHDYSFDLEAIGRHHSVSSTFLVRGDDVTAAIASTKLIHAVRWTPDSPPDRDLSGGTIGSNKPWLVVYLGTSHSGPTRWKFKSCAVKANSIDFVYEPHEHTGKGVPEASTQVELQYFYWVPLPALDGGTYELKLIDAKKGPRLIRYVDFP